jgi:hypothetical protein
MYKGVVRWHVACQKHPRFNPDKQGPGAIRGACADCQKLVEIQKAARDIRVLQADLRKDGTE